MRDALPAFCDDFYVNARVGSHMNLPSERESVLHFLERVQKEYPGLNRLRRGEAGETTIEEDRAGNSYRWLSIETKRLATGHVNPASPQEAMDFHKLALQLAPAFLSLSALEIEYIDLLYGFDFAYAGNHDELVSEALFENSPLAAIASEPGASAMEFQPSYTVALSEDKRLQARIDVVTRSAPHHGRTAEASGGEGGGDPISVYFIVRRFMGGEPRAPEPQHVIMDLAGRCDELVHRYVLPGVLRPIYSAISSRQ